MTTETQAQEGTRTRCQDCPFGISKIVAPEIRKSPLLVVGEAPGAEEIRTGSVFKGPSGVVLWQTLGQLGISREDVAVTNALLCAVPPTQSKAGGALKKACLTCRPRLLEDVELVDPKVILALGNTAMQSILNNFSLKITQERGRAVPYTTASDGSPRYVVPTLHPAAILRNPGDFKRMAADFRYAVSLLEGKGLKNPGETRFKVAKVEDIPRLLELLKGQNVLAADIETSDVNPRKHWIQYIGICWAKNKVAIVPKELIPLLAPLFEDPGITWVWHNGKFDTSFLQQLGLTARTDEDTMLLHYVLDEIRGTHDLEQVASELIGAPDYKGDVKKYAGKGENGWAQIPARVLIPYLAQDADYTYQIFSPLREQVKRNPSLDNLYRNIIIPASHFLQRVENRGIWVNPTYLEECALILYKEKEEIETRISELVDPLWDPDMYVKATGSQTIPLEFNPASPRQLSWVLYSRLGLRVPQQQGVRDTREETLRSLPPHPLVQELLRLRKVNKQVSTYIEGILRETEEDGRVHTTFLIHGTATGRLSSRNPNLQNIPRDPLIRDIFQAPPNRILVETDFASMELRMLAHLSKDPNLIKVFQDGRDLHTEVAIEMYGPNFTKDQRVRAKAVNFGIAYGRTEFSLAAEFKMPLPEAKAIIKAWFDRFPEAHRYINECRNAPLQGKMVQSPFGRLRRFPIVPEQSRNEIQNEAVNHPIQSGSSDLTLFTAMIAEPSLEEMGAHIVNLVHDSILTEVDNDPKKVDQVVIILNNAVDIAVRTQLKSDLTFPLDTKVGKAWGSLEPWK